MRWGREEMRVGDRRAGAALPLQQAYDSLSTAVLSRSRAHQPLARTDHKEAANNKSGAVSWAFCLMN